MKQNADLIIEYLKANGGSVTCAARELSIKLTKRLRAELGSIDDNLERYRYAFRRHGSWFTLPTDKASTRDAQKLSCVCLSCNHIHNVALIALVSGRSTGWHSCRMKERENIHVSIKDTDHSFASALLLIGQRLGQLYGQLQSLSSFPSDTQTGNCSIATAII